MKIDPETLREALRELGLQTPSDSIFEHEGVKIPVCMLISQAVEALEKIPAQADRLDRLEAAVGTNRRDIRGLHSQTREVVDLVGKVSASSQKSFETLRDLLATNLNPVVNRLDALEAGALRPVQQLRGIPEDKIAEVVTSALADGASAAWVELGYVGFDIGWREGENDEA